MACAGRRQRRSEIVAQAALVWCLNDTDLAEFIRCGSLPELKKRLDIDDQTRAIMEQKLDEYRTTGVLKVE